MPSFATLLAVASVALTVSAAPLKRAAPASWATGYLEEYDTYHTRYLALDCQDQHNTTFFESCCHPLLSTESLSDRPANCTPSASSVSSASAAATASASSSANTDAETEYCSDSDVVASYVSSAAAASSGASEVVYSTGSVTATLAVENNIAATSTSAKAKATSAAATSTSSSAAAATTSASSSSGDYSGYATYFTQNGNAGECGTVHSDSDHVIAINSNGFWQDYASNDNSPYCGKSVTITNTNNGKTTTATVADVCPTCDGSYSIDLSVGAFTAIATEEEGMVPITWSFN